MGRASANGETAKAFAAARALVARGDTDSSPVDAKMQARAHIELAMATEKRDHWWHAAQLLDRVLESHPDHADSWLDRARALQNLGQHAAAVEALDQHVLPDDPDNLRALSIRIDAMIALGRMSEAEDACAAIESRANSFGVPEDVVRELIAEYRREMAGSSHG